MLRKMQRFHFRRWPTRDCKDVALSITPTRYIFGNVGRATFCSYHFHVEIHALKKVIEYNSKDMNLVKDIIFYYSRLETTVVYTNALKHQPETNYF